MADNVIDAVCDLIEADGVVNARVWADDAPDRATKPYVTMTDAISLTPAVRGDGTTIRLVRQIQGDLWEILDQEDPAVFVRLYQALEGKVATLADGTRLRLKVDDAPRLPEVDDNIAHRALTISVRHDPAVP